jgi:hypothetical protein
MAIENFQSMIEAGGLNLEDLNPNLPVVLAFTTVPDESNGIGGCGITTVALETYQAALDRDLSAGYIATGPFHRALTKEAYTIIANQQTSANPSLRRLSEEEVFQQARERLAQGDDQLLEALLDPYTITQALNQSVIGIDIDFTDAEFAKLIAYAKSQGKLAQQSRVESGEDNPPNPTIDIFVDTITGHLIERAADQDLSIIIIDSKLFQNIMHVNRQHPEEPAVLLPILSRLHDLDIQFRFVGVGCERQVAIDRMRSRQLKKAPQATPSRSEIDKQRKDRLVADLLLYISAYGSHIGDDLRNTLIAGAHFIIDNSETFSQEELKQFGHFIFATVTQNPDGTNSFKAASAIHLPLFQLHP